MFIPCSECNGKTKLDPVTLKFLTKKGREVEMTNCPAYHCADCDDHTVLGDVMKRAAQIVNDEKYAFATRFQWVDEEPQIFVLAKEGAAPIVYAATSQTLAKLAAFGTLEGVQVLPLAGVKAVGADGEIAEKFQAKLIEA